MKEFDVSEAEFKSTRDVNNQSCTAGMLPAECVISNSPIHKFLREQGIAELKTHWETIWKPFTELLPCAATDRGAVAAAILTASIRKWLPRAPGFAILSGERGVGRTQLARALAVLAGGEIVVPVGGVPGVHFLDHTLNALTQADAFLIDDVRGKLKSNALEELVAQDEILVRYISRPVVHSVRTNVMVLLTGNFTIAGDLQRRFVKINLNSSDAYPERRRLSTRNQCSQHRNDIVTAAHAILGAFVAAGAKRSEQEIFSSYEVWDALIRQCVLWLNDNGIADLGDPLPRS